jgi:hypothetical protein
MTPQHSSLPGRSFHFGMTAQAYLSMECYRSHIYAIFSGIFNAKNSSFGYGFLPFNRLVRYCFHCFERWLRKYAYHLFLFSYLIRCKPKLCCKALYVLDLPGGPPWYKFTNYLKTKNRPFFNPSSWTVPVTWRSPERK